MSFFVPFCLVVIVAFFVTATEAVIFDTRGLQPFIDSSLRQKATIEATIATKRQMAKSEQQKNEALRLHKSGMVPSEIAKRLKVSTRTIQRWLKDETPVPVQVVGMMADKDLPPTIPKNIANCRDKFDITLSRRMAIRLMNLSEVALDAVEATLNDPDARRADKLRAAKLVGDWVGLGIPARHPSGLFVSIPDRLEGVFAVKLADPLPPMNSPARSSLQTLVDEEE